MPATRSSNTTADAAEIEASANEKLLTGEYLQLKAIDSFFHNNKFVMGDSIPKVWTNLGENMFVEELN